MLENLKAREKKLGMVTGALILVVIIYLWLWTPLSSELSDVRQEIQKEGITLAKFTKILNNRERIEKTYQDYLGIVKVGGAFQEEISKFLQEVEGLCRKSDVHVVDMKPLVGREEENLRKIHLEIEVDAQQLGLGKLLFELKNSQAMIHVDSVKISAGSRSEGLKCHLILSKIAA
ncbi:MAG: type II secretion system protein M [Chlamydiae bacterium]|nr:type II secretion system protein M [Chlamydiota bacterium]MBI3267185.1 type II secretion system protein M [Chlamydiota bacterium]